MLKFAILLRWVLERVSVFLNIVVALHAEAAPLIEFYKLKKISDTILPFPIFVNREKTIHLIVSGVGKIKSAIATTFIFLWANSPKYSCFLNVGIAGATQFAEGEYVLANKITEYSTGRSKYPFICVLPNDIHQAELFTHDGAQDSYPLKGMVDMEGSGFFQAASQFVSHEHIHVVKVISDNHVEAQQKLDEKKVKELIREKMLSVTQMVNYLMQLAMREKKINQSSEQVIHFQKHWHFSHAQSIQLQDNLRRWCVLNSDEDPFEFCRDEKNAKQVIKKIAQKLDEYANSLC